MRKYFFFMTGPSHWYEAAVELFNKGVAKPELWIGDWRHEENAAKTFGSSAVYSLDILKFKPWMLELDYESTKLSSFYKSPNYLRAKDRCTKMMDRLDKFGSFSRNDREIFFHSIITWGVKKFDELRPDFLIVVENSHSHPQYALLEIALFFDIPVYKFNSWMFLPLLTFENVNKSKLVHKKENFNNDLRNHFITVIIDFIDLVSSKKQYEPVYLRKQRVESQKFNIFKKNIKNFPMNFLRQLKINLFNKWSGTYDPINPFNDGFISQMIKISNRRKNLDNLFQKHLISIKSKEFIYFALHYEPERTTNPDGGDFHDQFIAIMNLRAITPNSVEILIKEHPTQLRNSEVGYLGRSPLFYKLIDSLPGLKLIPSNTDSRSLIKESLFVASIAGNVAVEAAILSKPALIFGSSWFRNCPNIINWHDEITFDEIINSDIKSVEDIKKYFIDLMDDFSFPGFHNIATANRFQNFQDKLFKQEQLRFTVNMLEALFIE